MMQLIEITKYAKKLKKIKDVGITRVHQILARIGPPLLTWINFDVSIDM